MSQPQIRAAGGVVWRRKKKRGLQVLVVHRDRYDDWTFPKGKLDAGETWREAAEREVTEETGWSPVVGEELSETRYVDHKGRDKRVRYWAMTIDCNSCDAFVPNDEVDEVRWTSPDVARTLLTYERDTQVLDSLLRLVSSEAR